MVDQPAEVLAEEAGHEGKRQEDRGQNRQLFDGGVLVDADFGLLDGDNGYVRLEYGAEQVALRDHLLVYLEHVVPDVAQVRLQFGRRRAFAGDDHPDQRVNGTVEVGGLPAERIDPLGRRDAAGEDGGLNLVDVVLQPGHHRRVPVDHLIQDRPERRYAAEGQQLGPLLKPLPGLP